MSDVIHIEPGERIVLKVRRHWILLARDVAGTILTGLMPLLLGIGFYALGIIPTSVSFDMFPYLLFFGSLWGLLIWLTLFIQWTNYYLDIWILTDRRVFSIEQVQLFERRVATWTLDHIQEITVHVDSALQTLLGFGTLQIETAGPADTHAKAYGIPAPEKIRTAILSQVGHVRKLEETTHQQENLIHTIGHEVKGYLTKSEAALAGIAEGDFGAVPEATKSVAHRALEETRKGVSTVMDILSSSSARDGTIHLDTQPLDLRRCAAEVVQAFQSAAKKKGLVLELIASDSAFMVNGDEMKLREQVMRNLVDNAIKYTPTGSVRVLVTSTDDRAVFSVQDSGIGISEEDLSRLFTPGGKGSHSSDVNAESTGYGLFIAKQIVEAHGGRIWVESRGTGAGSQFFVELPLAA